MTLTDYFSSNLLKDVHHGKRVKIVREVPTCIAKFLSVLYFIGFSIYST